jgi:hypothetical protein
MIKFRYGIYPVEQIHIWNLITDKNNQKTTKLPIKYNSLTPHHSDLPLKNKARINSVEI